MDFGLSLVTQFEPSRDLGTVADELVEQVELAREGGFASVSVSEHHVTDDQYLNNEAVMPHVAEHVGDVTLWPSIVLLPYHNPVRIAEYGATLDVLTGGQFQLGVGQGYRPEEFAVFGVDRSSAVGRLEEGVEIIERLWTEDEVTFDGEHFQLDGVSINPKPVQDPRPRIIAGASNERSVRRSARIADGWKCAHVPFDVAGEQIAAFRDERERTGRGDGIVRIGRETYVAETTEAAEEVVREPLMRKYESYTDWGQSDVFEADSFRQAWENLKEDRFVIGTPEEVIAEVERYQEAFDLDYFDIRTQFQGMSFDEVRSSIELFADEVIPAFD